MVLALMLIKVGQIPKSMPKTNFRYDVNSN
jgi:hypothetical protein